MKTSSIVSATRISVSFILEEKPQFKIFKKEKHETLIDEYISHDLLWEPLSIGHSRSFKTISKLRTF